VWTVPSFSIESACSKRCDKCRERTKRYATPAVEYYHRRVGEAGITKRLFEGNGNTFEIGLPEGVLAFLERSFSKGGMSVAFWGWD
jgi:hypothetical protein